MTRMSFVEKAEAAWRPAPDWVKRLAREADDTGQPATAKRIDYSVSTVSQIISNSYRGDLPRVEEMVRGALMSATVECPVLGEIGRNRCLREQDEPFRATSAYRAQLYHACRSGCPHSKHGAK